MSSIALFNHFQYCFFPNSLLSFPNFIYSSQMFFSPQMFSSPQIIFSFSNVFLYFQTFFHLKHISLPKKNSWATMIQYNVLSVTKNSIFVLNKDVHRNLHVSTMRSHKSIARIVWFVIFTKSRTSTSRKIYYRHLKRHEPIALFWALSTFFPSLFLIFHFILLVFFRHIIAIIHKFSWLTSEM